MSSRREQKKRATRQAILAAAMDLFAERGYEATSIGALARAAGVGKGTIYGYFRTKEDIFLAFCEEEVDLAFRTLDQRSDAEAPLIEQLVTLFMTQFRFVTRNREFGRILVREMAFPPALSSPRARELDNRYLAALGEILARAARRRELRADYDPFLTAAHFYALYLLALSGWYSGYLDDYPQVEASLTQVLHQALNGLRPPAEAGAPAKNEDVP